MQKYTLERVGYHALLLSFCLAAPSLSYAESEAIAVQTQPALGGETIPSPALVQEVTNVISGPGDVSKMGALDAQEEQISKPTTTNIGRPPPPLQQFVRKPYDVNFKLHDIQIQGMSVFDRKSIQKKFLSSHATGKTSMQDVYKLSGEITKMYRDAGYFLSYALVPQKQDLARGIIVIQVTEGYVGKVVMKSPEHSNSVIQAYIDNLIASKPLKYEVIESFLLRLNNLSGYSFEGILSPAKAPGEIAVLTLVTKPQDKVSARIGFNNYGSSYLSREQLYANLRVNLRPLQQLTIGAVTGLPTDDSFQSVRLSHIMTIAPRLTWGLDGQYNEGQIGSIDLSSLNINTSSYSGGTGLEYQAIQQRDKKLALRLSVDSNNTNVSSPSNAIANTPQGRVRAARFKVTFNKLDKYQKSSTSFNLTLSQGLSAWNATNPSAVYPLNTTIDPHFSKGLTNLIRTQKIGERLMLTAAFSGQLSTSDLLPSEQFGYGGQIFGRAYDPSQISGDNGTAVSFELGYNMFKLNTQMTLIPYVFYDRGSIWNSGASNKDSVYASSTGFGFKTTGTAGVNCNLGVAWPIDNNLVAAGIVQSPITGPRYNFEISKTL